MNVYFNLFLQWIANDPNAYQFLICIAAGIGCLIATCFYRARAKAILILLLGPVPKLSESTQLRQFEQQRERLRSSADNAATFAGVFGIITVLMLFWLFKSDTDYTVLLLSGALVLAIGVLVQIVIANQYDSQCDRLVAHRPELACLHYLRNLPEAPKGSSEDKLFWATLDDYVYAFDVGRNAGQRQPLDALEAKTLSDAQWSANHDEIPLAGDMVLIVWRDGTNQRVKVVVTKIKSVEDAPAESLMTTPGKFIIKAASQKFCGGKVAHYCDAPNEKIERGWLATADRAHVLLASLRWLDDHQREYCYQVINPGKSYPAISTWGNQQQAEQNQ